MAARLTVVGLGPAGPELVTAAAIDAVAAVDPARRWLRTTRHPAAGVVGTDRSFDDVYEAEATFEAVYRRIADVLVATALDGGGPVLYAVPGSPRVLERTVDLLAEGDSPEEFLEHTKLELFHDQVFCFTPKGRLIALPRGATAIDFAYAVHTNVGNSAVGAKINGVMSPLFNELQNGDEVEIVRADGQIPPDDPTVATYRRRLSSVVLS